MSYILLSFDVEEFDMPLEYGSTWQINQQLDYGLRGLETVMPLINRHQISCTFFTTAFFAENFPNQIRQISEQHEIASHTYYHSFYEEKHLVKSRERLSEIAHQEVVGLRMPRMKVLDFNTILKAGYSYDSSINPIYLPGRYNNLHFSTSYYKEDKLLRIPASVANPLRIPLFWLTFKNIPIKWYVHLAKKSLHQNGYLCIYFHPWEFIDLSKANIPFYAKKGGKELLLQKLDELISELKKEGSFITTKAFAALKQN